MSDYYGLFRPLFKYETKSNKKTLRVGAFWLSFLDVRKKKVKKCRIVQSLHVRAGIMFSLSYLATKETFREVGDRFGVRSSRLTGTPPPG
jgi:hypothetical protein